MHLSLLVYVVYVPNLSSSSICSFGEGINYESRVFCKYLITEQIGVNCRILSRRCFVRTLLRHRLSWPVLSSFSSVLPGNSEIIWNYNFWHAVWCADRPIQFRRRSRSWRYEERTWRILVSVGYPTVTMRKSCERKVVLSSRGGYLMTDFFLFVASTLLCACFPCLFVSKTTCALHF
jgi:hypothetical protein